MNDVKKIELIFENCECVDITKAVADLNISEITTKICKVCMDSVEVVKTAKLINFHICGDGILLPQSFSAKTYIDRILQYDDITGIEVTYDNNKKEIIYADFDGVNINKNQKSKAYKEDVFVVISADKAFEDVYSEGDMEYQYNNKDIALDPLAIAARSLHNEGWHTHLEESSYFQLQKDNLSITINGNNLYLYLIDEQKDYIIDIRCFYNICELVWYWCTPIRCSAYEEPDYYKYLYLPDDLPDKDEEGKITIPFKFWVGNNDIEATLNYDKDSVINQEVYSGNVSFEDVKLSTYTIYNLHMVINEFMSEEKWKSL